MKKSEPIPEPLLIDLPEIDDPTIDAIIDRLRPLMDRCSKDKINCYFAAHQEFRKAIEAIPNAAVALLVWWGKQANCHFAERLRVVFFPTGQNHLRVRPRTRITKIFRLENGVTLPLLILSMMLTDEQLGQVIDSFLGKGAYANCLADHRSTVKRIKGLAEQRNGKGLIP